MNGLDLGELDLRGVNLDLGVGFDWVGFWMCWILDGLDLGKLDLRGVDLGVGFGDVCAYVCWIVEGSNEFGLIYKQFRLL